MFKITLRKRDSKLKPGIEKERTAIETIRKDKIFNFNKSYGVDICSEFNQYNREDVLNAISFPNENELFLEIHNKFMKIALSNENDRNKNTEEFFMNYFEASSEVSLEENSELRRLYVLENIGELIFEQTGKGEVRDSFEILASIYCKLERYPAGRFHGFKLNKEALFDLNKRFDSEILREALWDIDNENISLWLYLDEIED